MELDTVVCMEALDFLRGLPNGSVDSVISDPPYGANVAEWDKDIPPQAILTECLRVSNGPVVWFGAADPLFMQNIFLYTPIPERILIWHVTFSLTSVNRKSILYKWHPIYCWNLPSSQNTISRDVLSYPTSNRINGVNHPAKKPLQLMTKLVSAFGGDLICDPFIGSGTTAVAARNLGRHYIGCDISEEYVAIANQRLALPFTPPLF